MSQRIKVKKRRVFTYAWIFGFAIVIFLLIYFQQTALLYVLATIGVTTLLVIVAASDLGRSERPPDVLSSADAQAAGSGISSKMPRK